MEQVESLVTELQFLRLGLLGKLALAALLGGVIGWEREYSDKPAGLRTNLLICVGAALLAHVSLEFATAAYESSAVRADPARIAAQIVSGIGFLGAGTIIQARGSVTGLTTAATLWVVAAIGLAVGGESYVAAIGATALVLVALVPLGWFEGWIARRRSTRRSLRLLVTLRDGIVDELEERIRSERVDVMLEKVEKDVEGRRLTLYLAVDSDERKYRQVREALVAREDVHEITTLDLTPS